jgi:hypothetical protein
MTYVSKEEKSNAFKIGRRHAVLYVNRRMAVKEANDQLGRILPASGISQFQIRTVDKPRTMATRLIRPVLGRCVSFGCNNNTRILARAISSSRPALSAASTLGSSTIKTGDKIPAASLDFGFPPEKVFLPEYTSGKKMLIIGLPGAFTPT